MDKKQIFQIICPTLPDPQEMMEEIRSAFNSGRVTSGDNVAALEQQVCERTGVKNVIAVSCATNGLMLLIRALKLPEGSEVITPTFTFAATSHALLWNGLKPVFCDSEPDSFTMDVSSIEKLITPKTSAIYPVCIFGVPGDLDAYKQIADKYGLALIYDSAQGLGSTYKGSALANFGDGEVFSLSPTKVVTAIEGGLVTTNNDSLAQRIRHMRDYGKAPDGEDMHWLGLSARMSEINAIVAQWSLARLATWIANRSRIMQHYVERLKKLDGLSFQNTPPYCTSSRNYMVILIDPARSSISRDSLYLKLKQMGVQTKRYFYPALHNQTLYRNLDPDHTYNLPVAQRISANSLALPMYSHMSLDAVDKICDCIEECCGQKLS